MDTQAIVVSCPRCGREGRYSPERLRHRADVVAGQFVETFEAFEACHPCGGTVVIRWQEVAESAPRPGAGRDDLRRNASARL